MTEKRGGVYKTPPGPAAAKPRPANDIQVRLVEQGDGWVLFINGGENPFEATDVEVALWRALLAVWAMLSLLVRAAK